MKIIYNAIENNHATQKITCNCQIQNDYRDGDYYNIKCPVCKELMYISVSALNKDMKNGGYARSRYKGRF